MDRIETLDSGVPIFVVLVAVLLSQTFDNLSPVSDGVPDKEESPAAAPVGDIIVVGKASVESVTFLGPDSGHEAEVFVERHDLQWVRTQVHGMGRSGEGLEAHLAEEEFAC